ncbi:unnamed protein product [Closterium sp. NIES-65]|nr:unnamed protein product [Closterium sp. NIES-65]
MAFEPALIDWQPTEDVGFEPVRNETFPLDPHDRAVTPPIGASDIVEVNLELHPQAHPEKVFPKVEAARNLRVVWNKDLLVHMLKGANESVWGERLRAMGVRIPYAFGCFVRYLLRPKPEVWHRMQPFEKQLRGDKVVSIGMHVRHFGRGPPPPNTTVSPEEVKQVMDDVVWPAIECAKGPPLPAIPSVQTFQETVTEWLLLSSCNSFVVSTSAFGRTAAMYSMHPMSIYTPQSCEPQTPVRVSSFGEGSQRQF